jgi:hypothetical protein
MAPLPLNSYVRDLVAGDGAVKVERQQRCRTTLTATSGDATNPPMLSQNRPGDTMGK